MVTRADGGGAGPHRISASSSIDTIWFAFSSSAASTARCLPRGTGTSMRMRRRDRNGQSCHWILEVHLVDRARQIGGFVEELLDIGTPATSAGRDGAPAR
jgi:hypothetical protein